MDKVLVVAALTISVADTAKFVVELSAEAATSLAASDTTAAAPSILATWPTGPAPPQNRETESSIIMPVGSFGQTYFQRNLAALLPNRATPACLLELPPAFAFAFAGGGA